MPLESFHSVGVCFSVCVCVCVEREREIKRERVCMEIESESALDGCVPALEGFGVLGGD